MKKTLYAIGIILLSLLTACNEDDYFELKRPNQFPWTSVSELELAVRQPYLLTMGNAWGSPVGALCVRGYAESDVAFYLPGVTGDSYYMTYWSRNWKNQILENNKELEKAFSYLYTMSTACNAPLKMLADAEAEGKDPFPDMTESDRATVKRYKGELLFMRAFAYYYLARTWAAPYDPDGANDAKFFVYARTYVNSAEEIKNGRLATVKEVYEGIVSDLKEAIECLPESYPSDEVNPRSRANKWVAEALLAKVCFYMGDHSNAKTHLDNVIGCGLYDVKDEPFKTFGRMAGDAPADECIWDISIQEPSSKFDRNPGIIGKCPYNTKNGGRGSSWKFCGYCAFVMSPTALMKIGWLNRDFSEPASARQDKRYTDLYFRREAYAPNPYSKDDPEYDDWFKIHDDRQGAVMPFVYLDKYFRAANGRYSTRSMIRLADLLLLRASILMEKGDKDGAAADVKRVRERAGLSGIPASSISMDAIEAEYIKEMAGEHASRLFWLIGMRKPIPIGDRDASSFSAIAAPYSDYYYQVPEIEKQNNTSYQN